MKKRLIPCLFLKNGFIIRSELFKIHQIIGNPISELERFSTWAVDEILYIDLTIGAQYDMLRADHKVKIPDNKFDLVREISRSCFVPLGFGGGVRSLSDIENLLKNGADKVVLNSILFTDTSFLQQAVKLFGSQALVACVDYIGEHPHYNHGVMKAQCGVVEWCCFLEREGIGEIIVNSIERDGTGRGYDVTTIRKVVDAVDTPVIALGGAGDYSDFVECFQSANPAAVGAGNIFHFREHSDYHIKKALSAAHIDIRRT